MIDRLTQQRIRGHDLAECCAPVRVVFIAEGDVHGAVPDGQFALAEVRFGGVDSNINGADAASHPIVEVPLPALQPRHGSELWLSSTPTSHGEDTGIHYATNDDVLFGYTRFSTSQSETAIEQALEDRYDAVLNLLRSTGYPHLMRIWNYLPHINDSAVGVDNYQRFCRARHHAFAKNYDNLVPRLPATTVVGTVAPNFQLTVLAGRAEPRHFENPRQVSAYHYPRRYGPKSPLFARATMTDWGRRRFTLFISGTASIVGHESRHRGDVQAQIKEVLRNIEALVDEVNRSGRVRLRGVADLDYLRVYVRKPAELGTVQQHLSDRVGVNSQVLYLNADICRPELLVELEAMVSGEAVT